MQHALGLVQVCSGLPSVCTFVVCFPALNCTPIASQAVRPAMADVEASMYAEAG